jgi:hypothetical protein
VPLRTVVTTSSSLAVPGLRRLPLARFFLWYSRSLSRFVCTAVCSCFLVAAGTTTVVTPGVNGFTVSSGAAASSSLSTAISKANSRDWMEHVGQKVTSARWTNARSDGGKIAPSSRSSCCLKTSCRLQGLRAFSVQKSVSWNSRTL